MNYARMPVEHLGRTMQFDAGPCPYGREQLNNNLHRQFKSA
jgi:hypothetical protein